MPVEDHAVHDRVKIAADEPYGCHSREVFHLSYYAPDRRYRPNGTFYVIQTPIIHKMSSLCRNFYLWDTDAGCAGCTVPKDTEYESKMKGLK